MTPLPDTARPDSGKPGSDRPGPGRSLWRGLLSGGKRTLWRLSPSTFRRVVRARPAQRFAIGIYRGPSALQLEDDPAVRNPVLTWRDVTDMPAGFVADPFMMREGDAWYLFFEALDAIDFRGRIAVAQSADGLNWGYHGVVLAEPFHLAYPYVFRWHGEAYMIPDAPGQGIRLYRAERFPDRWQLVRVIQPGAGFSDSSFFTVGGRCWLLSGWREYPQDDMSLRLFQAAEPAGPWTEHPASPVVCGDNAIARPAGRVTCCDGRLYRFAQDCSRVYGEQVRAFEIRRLTDLEYEEQEVSGGPLLRGGGAGWRRCGMHHVDAHRLAEGAWIACVDGWSNPVLGDDRE